VRVRAACWNVQSFRAGVDAVARAIAPAAPDLLLIQECGSRRALGRFAHALGMEAVSSHRLFHRVRNAVLFRPPWRAQGVEVADLSREGATSPRGFIVAHLRRSGVRLAAVSAHLGLSDRERRRHARELTDALGAIRDPMILGADLNEGPDGAAARWVSARLFDAFAVAPDGPGETFPAREPRDRIDFLFVTDQVTVARAWVLSSTMAGMASDHRPVLADVEVTG